MCLHYLLKIVREAKPMSAQLPLFPVTVVGSWPRPAWLLEALRQRQAGTLSFAEFQEVADRAVLEALRYQEEAGIDIVTDGEQRRDNFYSFVVEKLEGVRLMTVAEMLAYAEDKTFFEQVLRQRDVPAYAIKTPVVVDKVRLKAPLALDELEFLRRHTARPIKVPLPGPYLLTRTMWVQGLSDRVYPTARDLAADIVGILREEIIRLKDAGASFIQLDEPALTEVVFQPPVRARTFMCASLSASTEDPSRELEWATELINRTVEGIDGVRVGVHICRGNWTTNEAALLTGSYEPLTGTLAGMRVTQWVLEFATPRAGDLGVLKPLAGTREIGLGVVNPRTAEVESPEGIVSRVEAALEYFRPEQVFLNPDCGFGTFAEAPVATPEVAAAKLRAMVQAAEILRRRYG
jgi:5-methyltetrahydropteroyltriglutamate--homocysteine methyltransferase